MPGGDSARGGDQLRVDAARLEARVGRVRVLDRARDRVGRGAGQILVQRAGGREVRSRRSIRICDRSAIFDVTDPSARIANDEVFGPVLAVVPFRDEAEAIRLANGAGYDLAAAVWTRDIDRAFRLASHLRAGQVHINSWGIGSGRTSRSAASATDLGTLESGRPRPVAPPRVPPGRARGRAPFGAVNSGLGEMSVPVQSSGCVRRALATIGPGSARAS